MKGDAKVSVGNGIIIPERDRPAVGDDRLVTPARFVKGHAKVFVGNGIIIPERDRPAVGDDRLVCACPDACRARPD